MLLCDKFLQLFIQFAACIGSPLCQLGFAADSTKIAVQEAADDKTFGKIESVEKTGWGNGAYEYFEIRVSF